MLTPASRNILLHVLLKDVCLVCTRPVRSAGGAVEAHLIQGRMAALALVRDALNW